MATLGILLLWAGYTTGVFGFAKIKSAYGASPALSVSDLALPSHRNTYLAAAQAWGATPAAIPGVPAGTSAAAAPVASTDINTAIANANKQIAATCTKGSAGYNAATCKYWKTQLASLQQQGFGSP